MKAKKPRGPRNDKLRRGVITGNEIEDNVKPINAGFPRSGSKLLSTGVLVIFVVIFGLLTITSFQQKSPTVDEPVHLLSGYASLKWGDFRANPEHPPLAKALAAIPLLFFDIKDPRPSVPEWDLILLRDPRNCVP